MVTAKPVSGNFAAGIKSFSTSELYVSAPTVQSLRSFALKSLVNDNNPRRTGTGGGVAREECKRIVWYSLAFTATTRV